MRTIEIAGKVYPFILSSAAAKEFFTGGVEEHENDPFNTEQAIRMIHRGLKDGALTLTLWNRLSSPVPSVSRLNRILEVERVLEIVRDVFPNIKSGEGVNENEKKK